MAYFAVLFNDVVENVVVANDLATAEQITGKTCVEYTESNPAGIGYKYDKTTNTFSNSLVEETPTE